jgi:predicted dehydrogenase
MKKVKFGIVGVGGMGASHLQSMKLCTNAVLTAVCDIDKPCADRVGAENNVNVYYDAEDMYNSGDIDAVLIVTPHYSHTPLAISAFDKGIHVISDKPIAVHKADALKMVEAQERNPGMKFGVMYQLRTSGLYKKIKQLIDGGELGKINRINWSATHWYRTQAYYDGGTWRATWSGEGGGVLMNQCPHQLDLFQWFFGMPETIQAFGALGKYHNIEVEDDITAYFEFKNGASGLFIASTGEYPGTDRLEISADRGALILENNKLTFRRAEKSVADFTKTTDQKFGIPGKWEIDIPVGNTEISATEVIDKFSDAVMNDGEPMVSGKEGINQVELTNAMLYSMIMKEQVQLPVDPVRYEAMLQELIDKSDR